MTANRQPAQFSRNLLVSVVLVVLLAVVFARYVASREAVERAYESRHRSFLLADELRQSGDDLTRLVRTYVATGEPAYKQHFQDILAIRDGKKPRPENYWRPYWILMLPGGLAPRPESSQSVPLVELMREAGFTEEEFQKLAVAKANSDALTQPELEVMKLAEATGPEAEANRRRALRMLYDDQYHRAKISVMQPIDDFMALVDRRTLAAIQSAELHATALRYLFIAIGLGLLFMLWRTYAALRGTLGGSLDEVHADIARMGSGDFAAGSQVKADLQDSVLGWLAETQAKLREIQGERHLAGEQLRASEAEFRLLAEAMPQIVWVTRPDGWTNFLNRQWMAYTGLTLEESLGHGWNKPFHPDDQQRAWDAWQHATATIDTYSIECRLRRADGVYQWWLIRGVPVRAADGTVLKWFGTCTDIHDLKVAQDSVTHLNAHLEERVAERTAQLEAANKELEAFSYSVSHDLRAPLRGVDGYVRMLQEDCASQLDAEGNRLLGVVSSEARRMGELIDDLLAFSRMGRQKMERTTVDMEALARGVFEGAAATALAAPPRFVLHSLPPAQGDLAMLRQVLTNLLSNAVKFSRGQPEPLVEVGVLPAGEPGDPVTYFVRDNGVGFDMAHAGKLFGVFHRLHSEAEFEGTGVGLALVHRIIHRHGGKIWAESKLGAGATFYFTIPTPNEPTP